LVHVLVHIWFVLIPILSITCRLSSTLSLAAGSEGERLCPNLAGNEAALCKIEANITMNYIDHDRLRQQMARQKPDSFIEFADAVLVHLPGWLRQFGLTDEEIAREVPKCLLALAILVVQRRAEIKEGHVLDWLRTQTRNLVVQYWREADHRSTPPTTMTAKRTFQQLTRLEGGQTGYAPVAHALGVPSRWLGCRHRWLRACMVAGNSETT
jgi:hypothetical protein